MLHDTFESLVAGALVVAGLAVLHSLVMLYLRSRRVDIAGKVVFVTGCDHGFGNLVARRLDELEVTVLAGCLTEQGASALREQSSSRLKTYILDVTDEASVAKVAQQLKSQNVKLWGLINNAGIMDGGPIETTSLAAYKRVSDVNVFGMISVTKALLPFIRASKGRIVNVCSVAGRVSAMQLSAYCVSKYAAEAFSDVLRQEMAVFGVKVSIIEPGFFRTPLIDQARVNAALERNWESANDEVKEAYGSEFVLAMRGVSQRIFGAFASNNPSKVADGMVHAISAEYPRSRYIIGWDANLLWIPSTFLPSVVVDTFFNIIVKLSPLPLPRAVLLEKNAARKAKRI
ncbi:short chain dehydrogenase [Capsaspora owczarzaki ATCC 30864]|uniref:Short chain dehydrogenase n=1 Tax=Capsaspora owczarzaki (strain ATCC 30864) TaxID=595528 RepID=A0A0D2VTN6_CAPO3|nr:short chain dehydrogenase [Capsaspora owczarzaki ATCC 30864]KJE94632.1 short chain dehydrogenase [Capsaspora owczarzaki ATCC 30864]|eukprot:XP_004346935.1 short chain dehydrogenase [Capsaspora owczarzaki ATCC 30864]